MNKGMMLKIVSAAFDTNVKGLDTEAANSITEFLKNDIVSTIITTVIGIIAGYAFSIKSKFWRNFTFIACAVSFNVYMLMRMIFLSEEAVYLLFSLGITIVLCIVAICVQPNKEIVSRNKLGSMIEKFTESANPLEDVCIFAGDIDFFGDVIKSNSNEKSDGKAKKKSKSAGKHTKNIEQNSQYLQLKRKKMKKVCILCAKPCSSTDDEEDRQDRLRIGFLKANLKDKVFFRFFDDSSDSCTNDGSQKNVGLPDSTLRGRIVTNKETHAKCVVITTTLSSKKEYILRQYGSGAKESILYDIIWRVWWKQCQDDQDFVTKCKKEYEDYTNSSTEDSKL